MNLQDILTELKKNANPKKVAGMARFGISTHKTLGVSMPILRKLAKEIGPNHTRALQLWDSGIHEARILAGLIAEPDKLTEKDMETWIKDFDSWDVVDQVCGNLFDKHPAAYKKAVEWSSREEEFEKRAGFALMAWLAVHDKQADDTKFEQFLPLIFREATDDRNFVKKAVNWALRQIGKRNKILHPLAMDCAHDILKEYPNSKPAQWIAKDAIRELESPAVQKRIP